VNALGYAYATAPDSAAKEAMLLEVMECFHSYLMKYLCMIIRGTIPPANSRAGRDAMELLRTLAPRGVKFTKPVVDATCKTLHLAFKSQTTEDIYDTLVFCFVKAARQYDPYYADKIKQVCEVIGELPKQFTIQQLEARVGFSCTGILRYLVSKDLLSSIIGKKKVVGYKLGPQWPAPVKFFKSGPVGFTSVIQRWFRYYFKNHIADEMSEIETNEGVLQLGDASRSIGASSEPGGGAVHDSIQANADGNCVNATGKFRFMADRTLLDMPLDVSSLNLDWVAGTTDKLFKDLTVPQRTILFLYFHEEQSFKRIGKTFSTDAGICSRLVALTKEHEMHRDA
jgi:hypothetical protein